MSGPSDTTKRFYIGDNVKIGFKINPSTRHLDAQPPSGEHIDVDEKHFIEVIAESNRVVFTRKPLPVMPTWEQVHNCLLMADTFDDEVPAVMKLFGISDPKPTPRSDDEDEAHEDAAGV